MVIDIDIGPKAKSLVLCRIKKRDSRILPETSPSCKLIISRIITLREENMKGCNELRNVITSPLSLFLYTQFRNECSVKLQLFMHCVLLS